MWTPRNRAYACVWHLTDHLWHLLLYLHSLRVASDEVSRSGLGTSHVVPNSVTGLLKRCMREAVRCITWTFRAAIQMLSGKMRVSGVENQACKSSESKARKMTLDSEKHAESLLLGDWTLEKV